MGIRRIRVTFLPFIIGIVLFALISCNTETGEQKTNKTETPAVKAPPFSADTAYAFVEKQVSFGPRVPNTAAHANCAAFLEATLKKYTTQVFVQKGQVKAFDGKNLGIKNIIASFFPEKKNRIMLCAHWDTRPFADQDSVDRDKPISGANDGGSGVGILLEVARSLSTASSSPVGVDIIFFDAEDYGQPDDSPLPQQKDSYCLGSQYWAKNPPAPGYKPMYGILLDMVGAKNATFTMEAISMSFAPSVAEKVWKTASDIGYSDHFVFTRTDQIVDDHYYINTLAGIPTIDIIHYDASTKYNFPREWHTHMDTMDAISKNTLKAVGETLLEVIFREQAF